MKQYKLCTIREFAEYIADIIYTKREDFSFADLQLPDYDFAIADEDREGKTLAEIAFDSGGWYGMKKFDAGFDSNDVYVEADSKDEAWEKAQELWNDSEIILTADDFVKADFEAMESEELL